VAALFAVHPVHVESVAWVAERKDVLSTLFWMLTAWVYLGYVRQPRVGRYLGVLLLFALGLMAKAMLVTLPIVLLLLDYWPLGRVAPRADTMMSRSGRSALQGSLSEGLGLLWEKLPLFSLAAASSIVTLVVQQRGGAVTGLTVLPLSFRIENALVSYVAYISKTVWPMRLSAFYPYPPSIPVAWVVAAITGLAAVTVLVIRAARRYPFFLVGWLWYLSTLIPVIGLVQVGDQAMADRYTYVPLIGLFLMVGWGIPEVLAPWRYRSIALPATGAAVILACAITARGQVQYWNSSIALWTHAIEVNTGNDFAHNNLGAALMDQGKVEEAIAQFTEALRIKPGAAPPHYNLANALASQGEVDKAIVHYAEALRIRPNYAEAHNNLGAALASRGRVDEAIAHYTGALQIKPDYGEAHYNLGIALASQGRVEEAIAQYTEALRIKPDYADAHNNLGAALASQGKLSEAIAHYSEALRIRPNYAEAHNNLGAALASQGKLGEAVAHYTEALRIRPDYPEAHNNLGNALARLGRGGEAITQFTEALRLRPDSAETHTNLGIVLADQGRNEEALREWIESLRIQPEQPLTHYNMALLYERSGQTQEAVRHLHAAVALDPSNREAQSELGKLTGRVENPEAVGPTDRLHLQK
jgi:protein O-mannosyl-transferase